MNNEFVVRTKKPAQYFRGVIKQGYFPVDGKTLWYIDCMACSGGSRKDAPIELINYKETSRIKLITAIGKLATKGKYIFSFDKRQF